MVKKLHFIFLFTSCSLFAQIPTSLIEPVDNIDNFDEFSGSIYKNQTFKSANVIDEKSGTFDAKLRYNIHTDALEFDKGDELYKILKTTTIHARINEEYYYYCNFKNQRHQKKDGYYVLVELSDNYSIYKKYTLDIIHAPTSTSVVTNGEKEPGRIRLITTYYLEERGIIKELPTDKKNLVATFSDLQDELKDYMKIEKIRPRKEEDLKRLVAKYNALKNINSNGGSKSLLSNN
ncbi:hypothetical protein GCM10022393_26230 [Aquimarina addita]|uniref:DUF4468 domain-containing protein n=1 Tax=Aquimarina addita TaxID=870485 RepID=A0ABP6UNL0_9FLAO